MKTVFQSRHTSRGRALLTLLLGLGVTVALLFWASDLSSPGRAGSGRLDTPPPSARGLEPGSAPGEPDPTPGLQVGRIETGDANQRPEPFEKSFRGRGRLRVVVDTPPGVQFPPSWTLVLEPSLFLEGKRSAERRRVEFAEGEFEVEQVTGQQVAGQPTVRVELDDVPFGGYSVSVDAVDMNTTRNEVVLFAVEGRPDLPGRKQAEVQVRLSPAGFLDGSVVDEVNGGPVEGCPVRLADLRTGEVLEAVSTASGTFVFPSLRDGRYRLEAGRPGRVLHRDEFAYSGPERTLEPIRVPPMASAVFHIRDEIGGLVPNVLIEGYSDTGATLSARTDLYGEVRVPFLPAGEYRVKLNHPTGRRGKADFTLEGGEVDRLVEGVVRQ